MLGTDYTSRSTDSTDGGKRLQRGFAVLLVTVIVVGMAAAGTAGAQLSEDRFEENDDRSSATDITRDIYYVDLNIDDDTDEDYYAVSVNEGETIDTEVLFSHADGDVDLELLAPNGTVVAGSRSLTDDESISHTASQSGTYYVVVDGFGGDTASYELISTVGQGSDTVTDTETATATDSDSQYSPDRFEENDGQSTATSISRDIYYTDLNIDDESDEDYYSVSVNEGERIDTEVLFSDAEGDIDLGLLAPDGTFVAGSSSVTDDESISHTATQSGTYHIVVDGYLGDTASYELISTVSEGSDTVTETDTPSSGADLRSIGPGMTASGEIDGLDPSGYRGNYEPVTFQGAAGQEVTVEMSSETGDTYLILLDPSGNTVAADDDSGEGFLDSRLSHTLESSGQYTIVATSFNDMATFPYDLTLSISGESDASTDTIDLSANSTATAAGTIRVTYTLENTGDSTQAVVLNAGSGIDSLSGNWQTDSHQDAGGIWRSSEGAWLFDDLQPGETVSPSVTLTVPQDASGTYVLSTTAENDDGTTSTTVELRPGDLTIAEAVDTNGNGALDDSEILAAIEAWRTDSTVSGTNVRLSNSQIIDLIELWRQGGA